MEEEKFNSSPTNDEIERDRVENLFDERIASGAPTWAQHEFRSESTTRRVDYYLRTRHIGYISQLNESPYTCTAHVISGSGESVEIGAGEELHFHNAQKLVERHAA